MITKFNCMNCKTSNPDNAKHYNGSLGYEAVVCTVCGTYYDHFGIHDADNFSKPYIKPIPDSQELNTVADDLFNNLSIQIILKTKDLNLSTPLKSEYVTRKIIEKLNNSL